MVICLERGADLHMADAIATHCLLFQCFSNIQIGVTFLELAHPGSPGQRAVKRVCTCVLFCKKTSADKWHELFSFRLHAFPVTYQQHHGSRGN